MNANKLRSMESWGNLDAADILLSAISASYYKCAKAFAHKLEEARVWRGGKQRLPTKPKKRATAAAAAAAVRKKRNSSKRISSSLIPRVTKEQRIYAQLKKQSEADAAAAMGIRKSPGASIPSGRLLEARA